LQRFAILLGDRVPSRSWCSFPNEESEQEHLLGWGLCPRPPEILRFRARIPGPGGELRSHSRNPGP